MSNKTLFEAAEKAEVKSGKLEKQTYPGPNRNYITPEGLK